MKKKATVFFLAALVLVGSVPDRCDLYKNNNMSFETVDIRRNDIVKKKPTLKWFIHNPLLFNVGEKYEFGYDSGHSINNPDWRGQEPKYNAVPAYYMNEAQYYVEGVDSTGKEQTLDCTLPTMNSNLHAEGSTDIYFCKATDTLSNSNSYIWNDSRKMNEVDSYLYCKPAANDQVRIGNGKILYRSRKVNHNGTYDTNYPWDSYLDLSSTAINEIKTNSPHLHFEKGYFVEIVFFYEVGNFAKPTTLFSMPRYFHVLGYYNFTTV